tara:strand:- start:694 stop:4530 length:3837 start_codon:yes stop_codon:yes gene_type:complete
MPTKIVNINGSLNTESSEFDVGFDGFTELINLRQENGKLIRRKGTGALTSFSSKEIDTLGAITHRKLSGAVLAPVSVNNLTFGGVLTGVTCEADDGVFTKSSHNLSVGDTVHLSGFEVSGLGEFQGIYGEHKVSTVPDANTFTIVGISASDIGADLISGIVKTHIRMSLGNGTLGLTVPGQTADFRNVFKAGDTITIGTSATDGSVACANKDKALTIKRVDSSTVITFIATAFQNETLDTGTTVTFTFIIDRFDDESTPNNLQITSTDSYDGKALCITYNDSSVSPNEKRIALVNANDYGDLDILAENDDDSSYNALSGAFIRQKTYTDGIRFACGLEHSPLFFQYINRHHFNGLLKPVYNSNAHTLYPTWYLDTAVPLLKDGTYTLETFKIDDVGGIADSIRYINGTLNLEDNDYTYKFVPVYDGVQEELLENALTTTSTNVLNRIPDKNNKNSVTSNKKGCMLSTIKIDLSKLNPRTSAINVYRSTNNGTYYKIKSIYMGDNDTNQHQITNGYMESDRVWFSGGNTLSGGSEGTHTSLDSSVLMMDGIAYNTTNGTGANNFQSTGFKSVDLATGFTANLGNGLSRSEYGAMKTCKFNHISEETESILGGDDSCTGGSPNGGWYFASTDEKIHDSLGSPIPFDITNYDGNMVNDDAIYTTGNPFGHPIADAASTGLDLIIYNQGDSRNLAGISHQLNTGSTDLTGNFIISGWVRAVGLDAPDAHFYSYLNTVGYTTADPNSSGLKIVARGKGEKNGNIPWTYFQYKVTLSSDDLFLATFINIPDSMPDDTASTSSPQSRCVQYWGLSLREEVSGFELSKGLRGFMGENVIASSEIKDLQFPPGTLKGNRIQDDSTNRGSFMPVDVDDDRSYISDNYGPFIKCVDGVPGNSVSDNNKDSFIFGSSNYQFYWDNDNTSSYVKMDFFDPGLPDGARHSNETSTSTDVKFKYATMLNGRQFVANVKITADDNSEEYPNFVMFSNPGSPDVIPTSNFIKLDDLQGGEIVGIETLMSDIVVFMTRGIFRINVPSGDPTNWSLVESHPNIGCLHDRTIAKGPNGIYFGSKNAIYFLDSGFTVQSITEPIKSAWQTQTATFNEEKLNLQYDPKYNRLYVSWFPQPSTIMYVFDITRQVWYQYLYRGNTTGIKHMSLNHNNELIFIDRGTNSKLQLAEGSNYNDCNSASNPVEVTMKTGKQILSTLNNKTRVRRVNTITERSGGSRTLDLDVITDQGTQSKNSYLNGTQSTRVQSTGKHVQIEINNDGDSQDNNSYEIKYVDIEYE